LKNGWEEKPLEEICEILDRLRKPITKRDRTAGPYPYYGATGNLDFVDQYIFDEPLVLIGEDGAKWEAGANSAYPIDGKAWVNNHAHVLRPNRSEVLDQWLIEFLNYSDLMPYITGMTVPKLNQGRLRKIPIPLPPLHEQKRIVAVLDDVFGELDRAQLNAGANLASTEDLLQSILSKALAGGLSGSLKSGWEAPKLGDIMKLNYGKGLSKENRNANGEIPVYGANGVLAWSDFKLSEGPSLIVGRKGSAGEITRVDGPFWPSDVTYFTEHDERRLDFGYMHYCLKTLNLPGLARGVKPGINRNDVYDLTIPLPPLDEQKSIAEILDKVFRKIEQVRLRGSAKADRLTDLRQSLLQTVFAGELK
jgi:type I restriction enzyme, S subunit